MGKTLILTEKREVGTDMGAVLGDPKLGNNPQKLAQRGKAKGYVEGDRYVISWAAGHLFSQVMPKDIDERYGLFKRFNNLEDYKMPNLRKQMKSIATADKYKKRQRTILKQLLNRKDIDKIIIATDADAEGEAIGRDMIFKINPKVKAKIYRMWNTGSFKTKDSVSKAMKEIKPYNDEKFENLYASQRARATADYITGMKITKALTDLYNKPFYTGRVKSVIISLVGNRELEIKNFVPKDYWQIKGYKDGLELSHFFYEEVEDYDSNGNVITKRIKQRSYYDRKRLDEVLKDLKEDLNGKVISMKTTTTSSKTRPLPLSGSDFASEMMGKYKITYGQCNDILDYLRNEGFTTYPGTNGRYFSKEDKDEVIHALNIAKKYFNLKDDEVKFSLNSYIFNDKKAAKQNHTPLSLTGKVPTSDDIKKWQNHKLPRIKEAYELIAKRIAVAFLPDDKIEKQELVIETNRGNHKFDLTGQRAIKQGWRTFMKMEIKDTTFNTNPPLKEGDPVKLDKIEVKSAKTKPPALYTIKTLLDTLLNVSRVVDKIIKESDDPEYIKKLKEVKKKLKEAEGIGTDRTRESIINDLIKNKMIETKGKNQIAKLTQAGWELYKVLPSRLKSVVLTANWENYFEYIRRGELSLEDALKDIDNVLMNEMIQEIIKNLGKDVKVAEAKNYKREDTGLKCPLCDGDIIETDKVFKCSNNQFKNGKQTGCKFAIFKDQTKFFGKVLTKDDLEAFLNSTKESPLKGEKADIYFDKDNKYFTGLIFKNSGNFSNNDDPNKLIETPKTFKKGDKFVFKNFRGKNLTKAQAEKLLDGKSVIIARKSKGGKDYKVECTLKDNGGLEAEFVNG